MNERVKELRKFLNLTMEKFGERLGVKKTTISRIESGVNGLTEQMLLAICREFGVNEEWLRTGTGEMFITTRSEYIEKISRRYNLDKLDEAIINTYMSLDTEKRKIIKEYISNIIKNYKEDNEENIIIKENTVTYEITKEIPLYSQLVSAGTGQYIVDEIPNETVKVDAIKYGKADYAIKVKGDSMQPTYYDGDTLIVERNAVPDTNETGVFIVDGQSYVKRQGPNSLISDNKAYPNVKGNEGLCMGTVLGKI